MVLTRNMYHQTSMSDSHTRGASGLEPLAQGTASHVSDALPDTTILATRESDSHLFASDTGTSLSDVGNSSGSARNVTTPNNGYNNGGGIQFPSRNPTPSIQPDVSDIRNHGANSLVPERSIIPSVFPGEFEQRSLSEPQTLPSHGSQQVIQRQHQSTAVNFNPSSFRHNTLVGKVFEPRNQYFRGSRKPVQIEEPPRRYGNLLSQPQSSEEATSAQYLYRQGNSYPTASDSYPQRPSRLDQPSKPPISYLMELKTRLWETNFDMTQLNQLEWDTIQKIPQWANDMSKLHQLENHRQTQQ